MSTERTEFLSSGSMTLDNASMTKIYCKCGKIIGLDSAQTSLKFALKKNVECSCCRNARIAREIEELDAHFAPQKAESF